MTSSTADPYRIVTAEPARYGLFRSAFPSPHNLGAQYETLPRTLPSPNLAGAGAWPRWKPKVVQCLSLYGVYPCTFLYDRNFLTPLVSVSSDKATHPPAPPPLDKTDGILPVGEEERLKRDGRQFNRAYLPGRYRSREPPTKAECEILE
ncbi:hypothetical protein CH63R_04749 [Colletotrichum higginsianum IMI 349063]|uniref:Uncharacterized protein n=1 Tax=Colletotrichum higginsianum (strain IMI 349063) TaxID=759273 RepID=A0A1B7YK52_COLHI|nr:hypothetical protein CH63R_04749 [Colletotrichum higginsianum IMI 349063]OBR12453.1 hypothetical protein CH63R_04749 [Colletotrichum higginsianum IMI 349063]